MASIKLSEAELTALFGLPHLSIVLYMLGLRPRMDFANGTVGNFPLISWQALREAVYVEPHPGIKHEYASAQAVRRAAGWLEKAGLIRMRSHDRQLIFFLPLAHADYAVRNKADRTPTGHPDRTPTDLKPHEQTDSILSANERRHTEIQKADMHPVSGKEVNTSPDGFTGSRAPESAGREGGLIYPKSMTTRQQAAMAAKLAWMDQSIAQDVLDELAGCIQSGGVRNMPRLLDFFVDQVRNGIFMPDKGVAICQGRLASARLAARNIEAQRRAQEEAATFVKGKGKPDNLLDLVRPRQSSRLSTSKMEP